MRGLGWVVCCVLCVVCCVLCAVCCVLCAVCCVLCAVCVVCCVCVVCVEWVVCIVRIIWDKYVWGTNGMSMLRVGRERERKEERGRKRDFVI